MKHCIGAYYTLERSYISGDVHILCKFDHKTVCLVSLKRGNRWCPPATVDDYTNLTEDEWHTLTDGDDFVQIATTWEDL